MFCRNLICGLVIGVGLLLAPVQAQTIKIAGSSTVRPVIDKAVKEFSSSHPGTKFVVGGGGSGKGVKLVGESKVEIGMASRSVKASEMKAYPDLKPVKIGADAIVILVHKKNALDALTLDQLRQVYTGELKNWKDLGGKSAKIEVISSNTNHGTFDAFSKGAGLEAVEKKNKMYFKVAGDAEYSTTVVKPVDGNKATVAAIATKPNGIAYVSMGIAQKLIERGAPLKMLTLEGVQPSNESVLDGSYPIQRSLFVVINGQADGVVGQFIEFLTADPGQQIVETQDFIPLQ